MLLTEQDLKYIITESVKRIISEAQVKIDNFDKVANLMEYKSDDDFYFVQIIKRYKDNPHDDKSKGNYRGGAWYLNSWRIKNVNELMALKQTIIKICHDNNARAYVTVNSRSMKDTDNQIIKVRSGLHRSDPTYIHADDIVAAQPRPLENNPKSHQNWAGKRLKFFIDIDPEGMSKYVARLLFRDVKETLKSLNMQPIEEYETPSGGLHLVLPNREDPNFPLLLKKLKEIDDDVDRGRKATAHANIDGKIILYSNVQTKGY